VGERVLATVMERRGSECVLNGKIHIEPPIYPAHPLRAFLLVIHTVIPLPTAARAGISPWRGVALRSELQRKR